MSIENGKSTQDDLELIVDRIGLNNVVTMLAIICEEKAEHLETYWQDRRSAAVWRNSAKRLDKVSTGHVDFNLRKEA